MDDQQPEKLALAEPARALWKRIRQRLRVLRQSEEGTDPQAWMMGGGSILAARRIRPDGRVVRRCQTNR